MSTYPGGAYHYEETRYSRSEEGGTIAGSTQDPYEPRQIAAACTRLGAAGLDIRMFPGGHLTTSEHPDLLAAVIHERALTWLHL